MSGALSRYDVRPEDWFVGGGEMGKLVRAMDWSATPLGPIQYWPQSLRTTVSLCLASNFPISLAWGPRHVQIYNDGYWPICGGKHPRSMGQDFSECWASPWPVIGDAFERALAGETSYLENQRMFLDRNGYLEETFFTFSFSPIRDESGGVGGLFHPVTETTAKMLAERRTRALRDLGAQAGKARTTEDALALAAQTLSEFELDVPFALFYLVGSEGVNARLIVKTGSLPDVIATPTIDVRAPQGALWPVSEVVRTNQTACVDDLSTLPGQVWCGPYPEAPKRALVLPITPPGSERPIAVLVAGVSARLPLNEAYRAFYDLVASAVTSAVANARAYEEERKRAEALAEIDRAKTAFFSNVSHEFRTPLTLMLGPLEDELAERANPLPPARRVRLETAHRNSLRLMKLVNTLLDFSRIEAGRLQASFEPIELSGLTAELASVFRSAIERAGLELAVDCPPLPQRLYVDKDMWEKIVLNLLSNAVKHTFEGCIRVSIRWCTDHAELVVEDSGVGIPESELPHLFDRFHRVKGAKSRTHEGTGIGLALVQELVREHGGLIQVQSREGQGSTFTVTVKVGSAHLPRDRVREQASLTSTTTQAAAYVQEALHWIPEEASFLTPANSQIERGAIGIVTSRSQTILANRPRILWADDNADMRDYVGRLLAEHYEVTAVGDGRAALAAARVAPPDLVLSDVMMPNLDGFGLLRELRADERTRTVPVILLSARAGEESAVEGLQAGADDYLVKPFSARELLARVRTHLELTRLRREWTSELERQVRERTAELLHTCQDLEVEIADRQAAEEKLRTTQQAAMEQERLRVLGQMASGIAHDINNAISPIALYTESLLESEDLSPRARGYLQTTQRAIEDVAATIAGMREFYRKRESGSMLVPVRLNPLVQQVVELTRARWSDMPQQRGVVITTTTELAPVLPAVLGVESEIREALTNLIFNAVDAMPHGGTLCLRTRVQEAPASIAAAASRYVSMEVADTGLGMSEDTRRRCLEPFFTTKGERGTGLGLAMVYGMAERHGVQLVVESTVGQGTTVRLIFPVLNSTDTQNAQTVSLPDRLSPLRLLIVDDDPLILQSLADTLVSDGHMVVKATSGADAIEAFSTARARGVPFEAIITDLGMPHMDGGRVASAVKALSPSTPVILFTGWARGPDNEVDALHVDRVLGKPPKLRELREALASYCTSSVRPLE